MTSRAVRVSGVTALATAVLVLLPALAWLQYSWLEQIAEADRDRRERTLQTAASQLAQEFDSELSKAVSGLQLESSMVEQQAWASYASRYQAWTETAIAPEIVKGVYFIEGPELHTQPGAAGPAPSLSPATPRFPWAPLRSPVTSRRPLPCSAASVRSQSPKAMTVPRWRSDSAWSRSTGGSAAGTAILPPAWVPPRPSG